MHLLRCLFFFVAAFDIKLWYFLPGTGPVGQASSRRHLARDVGGPGNQTPRLDVAKLDRAAQTYFSKGLADSTQRTYGSGQRRYLRFCRESGVQAVPASERSCCLFATHLAEEGLTHKTIKVYLAGVRFLHIAESQPDPFTSVLHRLEYTLRGIKSGEKGKTAHVLPLI